MSGPDRIVFPPSANLFVVGLEGRYAGIEGRERELSGRAKGQGKMLSSHQRDKVG